MSRGMFYKGVALGAAVSITMLSAQAAFAGTGVGGIFNLGRSNSVNSTSTLTGSTSGAQLAVTNKSTSASATGLAITTSTSRSPFKVNSKVVVPNLNASYLQGKQVSDFLAATGIAADASKLGGKPASDYLTTTGTAADAAKLGGVPAAEYVSGCPLVSTGAAVGGSVAARALVTGPNTGASLSTNGVSAAWSCTGGTVWAQRFDVGAYCVVVDPAATFSADGWNYAGHPTQGGLVVPMVSSNSRVVTVSIDPQLCGSGIGVPAFTQYLGFTVSTYDRATGNPADGVFTFALL